MSWLDELKKPLYWLVNQDSRAASEVGRALHWDYLKDEGKRNQQNPGRAIGKAAATAASMYLGGLAGGASGAGEGLAGGGMFGSAAPGLTATTQSALEQQALQQAIAAQAAQAAPIASQGMFSQIPGMAANSAQAQALAEQTAAFGGEGANLTAQSAMPAVKDAYAAGKMGTMDYLGNVAKGDMAGMNDPSVWLSRLSQNAGRYAGSAGKGMAANMAMRALMPPPQQGVPAPMPRPQQQAQPHGDMQQLVAAAQAGDPIAKQELMALMKRLGVS